MSSTTPNDNEAPPPPHSLTHSLLSPRVPVSVLLPDYEANPLAYLAGLRWLGGRFQLRRVRGDGNCFYRALLFSYLETLLGVLSEGVRERVEEGRREHGRSLTHSLTHCCTVSLCVTLIG
jgi:hypothetical protein